MNHLMYDGRVVFPSLLQEDSLMEEAVLLDMDAASQEHVSELAKFFRGEIDLVRDADVTDGWNDEEQTDDDGRESGEYVRHDTIPAPPPAFDDVA